MPTVLKYPKIAGAKAPIAPVLNMYPPVLTYILTCKISVFAKLFWPLLLIYLIYLILKSFGKFKLWKLLLKEKELTILTPCLKEW